MYPIKTLDNSSREYIVCQKMDWFDLKSLKVGFKIIYIVMLSLVMSFSVNET